MVAAAQASVSVYTLRASIAWLPSRRFAWQQWPCPGEPQGVRLARRRRSGAGFLFAWRIRMAKELYRIGISGSYGGLNLGDEAILHSIIAQLRRDLPVEITVFSRDPEDTKRRHGVERAVPVRKMSRVEVTPR